MSDTVVRAPWLKLIFAVLLFFCIENLFCGEDKLALLEQEGGMFPTHFVQVNLALACANI